MNRSGRDRELESQRSELPDLGLRLALRPREVPAALGMVIPVEFFRDYST